MSSHESFTDVAFYDAVTGWAIGAPKGSQSGAGEIIYSIDGGNTWYDQSTTDNALNALAVTPSGRVWAVGEGGAVYTADLSGAVQPSPSPAASPSASTLTTPAPATPAAPAGKANGTPWGLIIGLAAAGVVAGVLAALLIMRAIQRRAQQPPPGPPAPPAPPASPPPSPPPSEAAAGPDPSGTFGGCGPDARPAACRHGKRGGDAGGTSLR